MSKWIDPRTWVTGEYIHPDLFNVALRDNMLGLRHQKMIQSADLTKVSSTAFSNLAGLKLTMLQGETWFFMAFSHVNTPAATNAKWAFSSLNVLDVATNSIMFGRYGIWGTGVPITNGYVATYVAVPGAAQTINVTLTAISNMAIISGTVNANVEGSIQLMAAQNTSNVGTTTFYQNSFMIAWRLDK